MPLPVPPPDLFNLLCCVAHFQQKQYDRDGGCQNGLWTFYQKYAHQLDVNRGNFSFTLLRDTTGTDHTWWMRWKVKNGYLFFCPTYNHQAFLWCDSSQTQHPPLKIDFASILDDYKLWIEHQYEDMITSNSPAFTKMGIRRPYTHIPKSPYNRPSPALIVSAVPNDYSVVNVKTRPGSLHEKTYKLSVLPQNRDTRPAISFANDGEFAYGVRTGAEKDLRKDPLFFSIWHCS